jgi:hypothetical protein
MATNKEWARKMIPVLIRWARSSWDKPHYYSNLSEAVGHHTNQIGGIMATIQDILDNLSLQKQKTIPTLNGLTRNKKSGLPSDGFDYVIENYSNLSEDSKMGEVNKLNYMAHLYDWDWVLNELQLEPDMIYVPDEIEKKRVLLKHGYGGEGAEHKALKNYVQQNPDKFGIKRVLYSSTEKMLLSSDRLDVYFETQSNMHVAVEVKPQTAPEEDVMRGIFQCVKYKAVMDAERVADYGRYENEVILVIGGEMSLSNKQLASDLGIKYFDNVTTINHLAPR